MKLYTSLGPNPLIVEMFIAEKGVEIEHQTLSGREGETRNEAHLSRNPAGQVPCLALDNGSHISEVTAICEYLEEKYPEPALIGKTAEERAITRMWTRRLDLNICEPMIHGFHYGEAVEMFRSKMRVIPQAADDLKAQAQEKIVWLNGLMGGSEFICGDEIRMADIHLFCFLKFGVGRGQPFDRGLKAVSIWYDRMDKRPSVNF